MKHEIFINYHYFIHFIHRCIVFEVHFCKVQGFCIFMNQTSAVWAWDACLSKRKWSCLCYHNWEIKNKQEKTSNQKVNSSTLGRDIRILYLYYYLINYLSLRKIALTYEMFHQVRVDGGKEFYLTRGIQKQFSHLRSNEDLLPYRQTQSRKVRFSLIVSSFLLLLVLYCCCSGLYYCCIM